MLGAYCRIGLSQSSLPSSTSRPAAMAVNSLVFDAMGCVVVAVAVAFREHELVFHDDADTDARHVPVLEHLRHVSVETLQARLDAGGLGGDRGNREENDRQEDAKTEKHWRH